VEDAVLHKAVAVAQRIEAIEAEEGRAFKKAAAEAAQGGTVDPRSPL